MIENNGYAISVPSELESAVEDIAVRGAGYAMPGVILDGDDVLGCYRLAKEAIDGRAAGEGPTLLEAKVTRLTGHSSDDQQTKYRSAEELAEGRTRDPLPHLRQTLRDAGVLDDAEEARIAAAIKADVEDATDCADASSIPIPSTAQRWVYADAPPARMDDPLWRTARFMGDGGPLTGGEG